MTYAEAKAYFVAKYLAWTSAPWFQREDEWDEYLRARDVWLRIPRKLS